MKAAIATVVAMSAFPAFAQDDVPNYKNLMRQGYEPVGAQFFEDDFVILLSRGASSFLCTLNLVKEDQSYSGGPWNEYRACKRLSGGLDLCFDKDMNQMECKN